MHKELPKFLAKLKERGFSVKLDTNGFFPYVLEECIGYVDFVAMDVKTCREKYKLLGAEDTTALMKTMEILKTGKVPYEFRTTVVPQLVTAQDANCIGEMVNGSKIHTLQQFIPAIERTIQFVEQNPNRFSTDDVDDLQEFLEYVRQLAVGSDLSV